MKQLTAKKLDNLQGKRRDAAIRLWDGDGSGFGAKVSAAGRITFFQFYYAPIGTIDAEGNDISGKRRFMTLGTYSPEYGLAAARRDAGKARNELDQKRDPQEAARLQREHETRTIQESARRGTMASVLALYLRHLRQKNRARRYIHDVRRAWARDVWPVLPKTTKAAEVTEQDIRRILHRPLSRRSEHSARTLRASLHLAFKLAKNADNSPRALTSNVTFRIPTNPVTDVPLDVQVTPGNRALSFMEIGRVWNDVRLATEHPHDALLIQLLIAFGGQHITELREATWDEFDLVARRWFMLAERHKNRTRDHLLPINDTAYELLTELHAITGGSGYLFSQRHNPRKPMRVERPGSIVCELLEWQRRQHAEGDAPEPLEKFTAADFRRTCKTRMHEIGIPKTMTNQLHNHDFGGVAAKHYDRFDYWEEKLRAMGAWNVALQAAINGHDVPLAKCRAELQWKEAAPVALLEPAR